MKTIKHDEASALIEKITQRAELFETKYDDIEALFLLSIYNGARFKVNLNHLLLLDLDKRIELLKILEYDVLSHSRFEIHTHIQNGTKRFEKMAKALRQYDQNYVGNEKPPHPNSLEQ